MGNLLTSLLHSADAMRVYDRQLAVVQNNVANASTPGYVKQTQTLNALPFQLDRGFTGGVEAGAVETARSEYAEQAVRRQQSSLGEWEQKATDLAQIESQFDLSSSYGVAGSLEKFFQSFSQLSINPNDTVARQSVIDRGTELAQSVNQVAVGLSSAGNDADRQIRDTVDAINRLAGQVRDINQVRQQDASSKADAGLDAQLHNTLEQLSELGDVSVLEQPDGSLNLLLGGQTPLVIGSHQYAIQADFSSPTTAILDANSADVTKQIGGGKLAGLLDEKNQLLPGYMSDLNQLAQTIADQVNLKLSGGVDSSGAAPVNDFFTYDAQAGTAMSLSVTGITPDQIAAAYSSAPGGNGNALDLASMIDSKLMNGFTLTQAFGNIGSKVGRDLSTAKEQQQTQTSMVAQSRNLRDQVSAVDINEEAAHLLQIQRAYQAAGKLMSVLNDLTDTVINIIR